MVGTVPRASPYAIGVADLLNPPHILGISPKGRRREGRTMTGETCSDGARTVDHDRDDDDLPTDAPRFIDREVADDALTAVLPPEMASTIGRFLGREPVRTLGEWAAALRDGHDVDEITTEELCLTTETTPHRGVLDGETFHFACFYDAVILAAMTGDPVDIRTESPEGATIEARAVGTDELTVDPPEAVFSLGIALDVEPPGEAGLHPERGYEAICPYVRAFPDREVYDQWAASVPAATVGLPLEGATAFATALVG